MLKALFSFQERYRMLMSVLKSNSVTGFTVYLLSAFCAIAENTGPNERAQLLTNWHTAQFDRSTLQNRIDTLPAAVIQ